MDLSLLKASRNSTEGGSQGYECPVPPFSSWRYPTLAKHNKCTRQGSLWMQSIKIKSAYPPSIRSHPAWWRRWRIDLEDTQKIKHSACFFFPWIDIFIVGIQNPLTPALLHAFLCVIYCYSSHILQLCEPCLTSWVSTFLKFSWSPFPHFHLVFSSFKSYYKCYLLFAALLMHPSELLAPQNISPPCARSRRALCTTHSTLNKRSYDFTTSLATGPGVGLFWEEQKCDSPA